MAKKRPSSRSASSPVPVAPTGGRGRLWIAPALAGLVYASTLSFGYTLDDVLIVERNPLVTSGIDLGEIFHTPYWGAAAGRDSALYRPVTIASYALGHAVFGGSPVAAHAVNVLLHALASLLLAILVRDLFRDERLGLVAGALFAVHTIHTEAVAGIVGRAEMLALLGILGGTWAWFRAREAPAATAWIWNAASGLAYLGGALSKEGGLVAPAFVCLGELLRVHRRPPGREDRRRIVHLAGTWVAAAAIALTLRAGVVAGHSVNEGFLGVSAGERFLTGLRVCGEYVGLLLAPVRLSADYWVMQVPISRGPLEPRVLLALGIALGLATLAIRARRERPAVAWGLVVFAAALFPVSNLAFPVGVIKAERLLYAPSAGFLVAAAGLLAPALASKRWRRLAVAGVAIVMLALSVLTWRRNEVWRDNCTLAAATLERSPDSPIFLAMHARCLLDSGRPVEARAALDRALAVRAGFPTVLLTYGMVERLEGNWSAALEWFERLLAQEPGHSVALENAAWLAFRLERYDRAAGLYERWRSLEPDRAPAWSGAIASSFNLGNLGEARRLVDEALRRFPGEPGMQAKAEQIGEAERAARDEREGRR